MSNNSPDPGVPQTGAKAITAGVVAAVVLAVLMALQAALADGHISSGEWVTIAIAGVVGSGLVGGATYGTKNKRKA